MYRDNILDLKKNLVCQLLKMLFSFIFKTCVFLLNHCSMIFIEIKNIHFIMFKKKWPKTEYASVSDFQFSVFKQYQFLHMLKQFLNRLIFLLLL